MKKQVEVKRGYQDELDLFRCKLRAIDAAYSASEVNLVPYDMFATLAVGHIFKAQSFTGRVVGRTPAGTSIKSATSKGAQVGPHYHDFDEVIEDPNGSLIVVGVPRTPREGGGAVYKIARGVIHSVSSLADDTIFAFLHNPDFVES